MNPAASLSMRTVVGLRALRAHALVLLLVFPVMARAQNQVINFPVANTTGWGTGGCSTLIEKGTTTQNDTLSMVWTDTTGATAASLAVDSQWKFNCTGSYELLLNGTLLGPGTLGADSCSCGSGPPYFSATQTFASVAINPLGTNTLVFRHNKPVAYSWIGVMNGSLGWATRVSVTTGPNSPPVLSPVGNKSVAEGATLAFDLSATDPDNNPLTYSGTGLPAGATVNATTGAFRWTPSYTQAGTYNLNAFASDGTLSATQPVSITVVNANQAPQISPIGNKSVSETTAIDFTVTASDSDGDVITLSAAPLPPGATFSPTTGAFHWVPSYSQGGNRTITFTASDASLSSHEDVVFSIGNINRPPELAAIGKKTIAENALLAFTLAATDPDLEPLTFAATGLPSGATLNPTTGAFAWTPSFTQAGVHSVVFSVTDGDLVDSETVSLTVNNTDRAPELEVIEDQTVEALQPVAFKAVATDPDLDDKLSFTLSGAPPGATINAVTGTFEWTPRTEDAGPYPMTVVARSNALSASRSFTLTVVAQGKLHPAGCGCGATGGPDAVALLLALLGWEASRRFRRMARSPVRSGRSRQRG